MDREQGDINGVPPLCVAVSRPRLNAVRVLLDAGADIHVQNDRPIRNAVSGGGNVAVMEMLAEAGWDPSTGTGQMLQDAAETLNPELVRFLASHGVGPDVHAKDGGTALDMALNTYETGPGRPGCIDALIEAGARHEDNAAFDLLRGRLDLLEKRMEVDPECISRHYDLRQGREHYPHTYGGGSYGAPLQDTTLLHMCAHYGYLAEAQFLLERGADPNARALSERSGCDHTPIYHAVTSNRNFSYPVLKLRLECGADPKLSATIHIDNGRDFESVTPLGYATEFPKEPYDILPEVGVGASHEPHRRVAELLQKAGVE
jgi:ankyrin repeat protein